MQSQLPKATPSPMPDVKKPAFSCAKVLGFDPASGPDVTVFSNIRKAQFFTDKSRALLNKSEGDYICNAASAIMTLALLNREILHINVGYSPEVNGMQVKVFNANSNYFGKYDSIFSRSVYLDQPSTHLQLQTLEDDLIDLIASEKDRIMGAV